jgi:formate-dependent nitrite reductase membrane component NrfD
MNVRRFGMIILVVGLLLAAFGGFVFMAQANIPNSNDRALGRARIMPVLLTGIATLVVGGAIVVSAKRPGS